MGTFDDYRRERTATIADIATAIVDTVTIEDALSLYRPDIQPRHHRCPCPIHNGKDYNLSYTDRGFKCFVCNEAGDVIHFVQGMFSLPTRLDAMKKISSDFDVGVYFNSPVSAEASAKVNKAREEHESKRKEWEAWEKKYHDTLDEWIELDRIISISPQDPEFDFKKYCEAKSKIVLVDYRLNQVLDEEPR